MIVEPATLARFLEGLALRLLLLDRPVRQAGVPLIASELTQESLVT